MGGRNDGSCGTSGGGSSRKHHIKKVSTSHYKERLQARGLSRAPEMPSVESLRKLQERRAHEHAAAQSGEALQA